MNCLEFASNFRMSALWEFQTAAWDDRKPSRTRCCFAVLIATAISCSPLRAGDSIDFTERDASTWGAWAAVKLQGATDASVANSSSHVRDGAQSVLFTTSNGTWSGLYLPKTGQLNFDASSFKTIEFWEFQENTPSDRWLGNTPHVIIWTAGGGNIELRPSSNRPLTATGGWRLVAAPLVGLVSGWERTTSSIPPDLSKVTRIEIRHDTTVKGLRIWVDSLRFKEGAVPSDQIFWFGDQATCDGTSAYLRGSFHNDANWLNGNKPKLTQEAAFFEELPEPLQSPGTQGAAPYSIFFGDCHFPRGLGCINDSFNIGGVTVIGSVRVGSGSFWEFHFRDFLYQAPYTPTKPAPLTVLGQTIIAHDQYPQTRFQQNVPYRIWPAFPPILKLHSGTMTSGPVMVGGSGPGTLHLHDDAVLKTSVLTVAKGGLLSGNGLVRGTVSVLGGKIAPGNSPGKFTVEGDLDVASDGEIVLEVGGTVPGQTHDQLVTTGKLDLSGTLRLRFIDGYAPRRAGVLEFFRFNGVSGAFRGITVEGLTPAFQYDFKQTSPQTFSLTALNDAVPTTLPPLSINHDGNQVTVSWPEQATGFYLQSTTDPASPAWQPRPTTGNRLTVPAANPREFFRLVR